MKKLKLLCFLGVCFFLLLPTRALAGVGGTTSGGGSAGGGSTGGVSSGGGSTGDGTIDRDRYYYSHDSYSRGDSSSWGEILSFLAVGAIILLPRLKRSKNNTTIDSPYLVSSGAPQHNEKALEKLKRQHPDFDEVAFVDEVETIYLRLQEAWTAKQWQSVKDIETPELYQEHLQALQPFIRKGTTNHLDNIRIGSIVIRKYQKKWKKEELTVIMSASLRDYIKNDKTDEVLEGEPFEDLYTVYRLVFVNQKGKWLLDTYETTTDAAFG